MGRPTRCYALGRKLSFASHWLRLGPFQQTKRLSALFFQAPITTMKAQNCRVECPQARRATLATNCRVASTNVELGAISGTGRDAAVTELRCISAYSDGHGQTGPALILASSVPQVIQIDRPMARRPNRMRRLAKSRHAYHEDSAQQKDQQENSPSSPFYSKQDTCFKRHDLLICPIYMYSRSKYGIGDTSVKK